MFWLFYKLETDLESSKSTDDCHQLQFDRYQGQMKTGVRLSKVTKLRQNHKEIKVKGSINADKLPKQVNRSVLQ